MFDSWQRPRALAEQASTPSCRRSSSPTCSTAAGHSPRRKTLATRRPRRAPSSTRCGSGKSSRPSPRLGRRGQRRRSRSCAQMPRPVPGSEDCPKRSVNAEIALARRDSHASGSRHVGVAEALVQEMPCTMAALESGELSEWRATIVVRETACLSREDRARVDAELDARPGGMTKLGNREIAAEAKRIAYRLDPHSAVRRARKAKRSGESPCVLRRTPCPTSRPCYRSRKASRRSRLCRRPQTRIAHSHLLVTKEPAVRSWPTPWWSESPVSRVPRRCPSRWRSSSATTHSSAPTMARSATSPVRSSATAPCRRTWCASGCRRTRTRGSGGSTPGRATARSSPWTHTADASTATCDGSSSSATASAALRVRRPDPARRPSTGGGARRTNQCQQRARALRGLQLRQGVARLAHRRARRRSGRDQNAHRTQLREPTAADGARAGRFSDRSTCAFLVRITPHIH